MPRLSVILITYNEERNIERCLHSVRWADEIIVVDSFSTDRTLELAKKYTENIIQHSYDGDIRQRERGFEISTGDWLFYIDADEEMSPELAEEIRTTIVSDKTSEGYNVPRKIKVFDKWIFHGGWYPDHTFRLFKKGKYRAEHAEVHGGFTVDGVKGTLQNPLYHYTYNTIEDYFNKMNPYTSLAVSNKLKDNPNIGVTWMKIVLSPLSHFLRKFFINKGYKDGFHGFLLAAFGAIYTLALYAKIWEYRQAQTSGRPLPPITNAELTVLKKS